MFITSFSATTHTSRTGRALRPTYADLVLLSDAERRTDRSSSMPLLGFFTGLTLAVILWSAIGWVAWALLA